MELLIDFISINTIEPLHIGTVGYTNYNNVIIKTQINDIFISNSI